MIRLIMHCRMQYFSFNSKEELTLRECKTNPLIKILNKLSRESFLTKIEYDAYKFITDYFTKKQFLFDSSEMKKQFLGSFNIVIQFLYSEAVKYTTNIRKIENVEMKQSIEDTASSTSIKGEIAKVQNEVVNDLKPITKIQENQMEDNIMNESKEQWILQNNQNSCKS